MNEKIVRLVEIFKYLANHETDMLWKIVIKSPDERDEVDNFLHDRLME
jgi:hypothetical protein